MFTVIRYWLRAAFRRDNLEREMNEEMQLHLDRSTARLVARGMSAREARNAARREFGNVAVLAESGRDARGANWVESVRSDVRYALRGLRASPAFAIVACLSLAIGIGANTTIFSLINAVMLKSLPVDRPEELMQIAMTDSGSSATSELGVEEFTNPIWEAVRENAAGFAVFAVSARTRFNLSQGGEERTADGAWVNGDYFNALGLKPAAGRLFATSDDVRGCARTAVISFGFWQSELGGREDAIGSTIHLTSVPYTVIGVGPEGFTGVDVGVDRRVYAPICAADRVTLDSRTRWWLRILGRPRPGLSITEAGARLNALSRGIFESTVPSQFSVERQAEYRTQRLVARRASNGISEVRDQYSSALLTLMGMVGLILLISCANVANLLIARGAARGRETAIRVAIGAAPSRLILQHLTEGLVLAGIGAVIGAVFAQAGSRFLVGMLGTDRSRVALDLSIDLRVLAFTTVISLITVVLCAIAPALRAMRIDPQTAMKAGGRGTSDGPSRFALGKLLVVAQCALALILVVGAGLLVGTFSRLASLDAGFHSDGVLIASVDMQPAKRTPRELHALQQRILDGLRARPDIRTASLTSRVPLGTSSWNEEVVIDGVEPLKEDDRFVWFYQVSDQFFRTLGTPLVAGRDFSNADVPSSTTVAIVNRAMARKFFGGGSPVGRTYRTQDQGKRSELVTIIGLVEDTKYRSLREQTQPIIYVASSQDSTSSPLASYAIQMAGPSVSSIAIAKTVIGGIDPRFSMRFTTLSRVFEESLSRERVLATLSAFFGALALMLAMIGLYGVMAYNVARRRVEIGIRVALGAARSRVVGMVLGDVGRMIVLGIAIGGVGAFTLSGLLKVFLFGVEPNDPRTIIVAAALLALGALVAGAIPARRAASMDPLEALRED